MFSGEIFGDRNIYRYSIPDLVGLKNVLRLLKKNFLSLKVTQLFTEVNDLVGAGQNNEFRYSIKWVYSKEKVAPKISFWVMGTKLKSICMY